MTGRDGSAASGGKSYAQRMLDEARRIRSAAEAAFLPAVRGQLMARVIELENASTGGSVLPVPKEPSDSTH